MSWKCKLSTLVFMVLLACSSSLLADGRLNGDGDHQIWLEERVSAPICENWRVLVWADQRWGKDMKKFWYSNYGLGIRYDATCWFIPDPECSVLKDVGVAIMEFRDNLIQRSNRFGCDMSKRVTKWVTRNRPTGWFDFTLGYCGWSLYSRCRVEYLSLENNHYSNYTRYRQLEILYTPWKWTDFKINPFIYDEMFFRGTRSLPNGLYTNRFRVGVDIDLQALDFGWCLTDGLRADAWWQWRILKNPRHHKRTYNNTYCWGSTIYKDF